MIKRRRYLFRVDFSLLFEKVSSDASVQAGKETKTFKEIAGCVKRLCHAMPCFPRKSAITTKRESTVLPLLISLFFSSCLCTLFFFSFIHTPFCSKSVFAWKTFTAFEHRRSHVPCAAFSLVLLFFYLLFPSSLVCKCLRYPPSLRIVRVARKALLFLCPESFMRRVAFSSCHDGLYDVFMFRQTMAGAVGSFTPEYSFSVLES
jgi:hypothetical protein